jgi:hypothetical protein
MTLPFLAHRLAARADAWLGHLRQFALTTMALALAACGGMEDAPVTPAGCDDCGTAVLSMTDAAGDFLSYEIDVTSIELTRADGSRVQTLPATTRVDFAQLVDMSEVISVGQIPAGAYVSATLNVNYSNADIVVDDGTGAGVSVNPVTANNQPAGAMALTVQLERNHPFIVNRGLLTHLAFDFDLLASNTVDLPGGTVTVSPFVVAGLAPPGDRDMRARGPLAQVDTTANTYTILLRPFHRAGDAAAHRLVVHVDASTAYEINGEVFAGAAGLAQMATLTDTPMTVAFGSWQGAGAGYLARRVLVGTSLPGANRDYVSGSVLSRRGNSLVLGNVRLDRRDGSHGLERRTVAVTVGAGTKVTRAGQTNGTLDSGAISVGQHVEVLGVLDTHDPANLTLDATTGRVRLDFTRVFGRIVATSNGGLTLNLASIDGRLPAAFDFSGTGASTLQDADPAHYEVSTAGLDTTAMPLQAYTRLIGFVSPFGTAPPDFNATTFVDYVDQRALLGINWAAPGATAPFLSISTGALAVDLGNSLIVRGGIAAGGTVTGLGSLSHGLQIVPATSGVTVFAIGQRTSRTVERFASFAEFSAALSGKLTGSVGMMKLDATGEFNATTGQFAATRLLVVLSN